MFNTYVTCILTDNLNISHRFDISLSFEKSDTFLRSEIISIFNVENYEVISTMEISISALIINQLTLLIFRFIKKQYAMCMQIYFKMSFYIILR